MFKWHRTVPGEVFLKAYLTQDIQLRRLSTRVNRTQPNQPWPDPSNTRAIRLIPWKPYQVFKTKQQQKNGIDVTSVCDRINGRTWPWENMRDRMRPCIYNRTWSPLHERSQQCQYVPYTNRMESYENVPKSYIQHPECTHGFLRSPYDQYGLSTNHTWSSTVIHGLTRPRMILHGLYMCVQSSCKIITQL